MSERKPYIEWTASDHVAAPIAETVPVTTDGGRTGGWGKERHWLSDCRPDLVEHEEGPLCTWAHRLDPADRWDR